uniref:Uncharacterized protein n=1 Tax=viral metagenome TaxID=1070528 RepID=A0A6C0B4W1_9ZZZZ
MASQDPSTAYGAAPEKPKSFFSSFPSFSMPKLPDFFGTGSTAPAPAPASAPAVAEQSSVQPGGRRRRHTKKAGRRRRHTRRGGDDEYKPDITFVPATPVSFPPTKVRRPTGRGRRTRRGGVETPMQKIKYGPAEYKFLTDGYKRDFPPTQVRRPKVESPPVQAPNPTGKGRRTRRVKKHSRR